MNRITRGIKSFLARRIARKTEIRTRRFRRSLHDKHREAMRYIRDADRRARGLRLYAAWSSPKRAATAPRPILLLGYSLLQHANAGEKWTAEISPHSSELLIEHINQKLTDEQSDMVISVPAEFKEHIVLIDLKEVASIGNRGLALLIEAMHLIAANGGDLVIVGVNEGVRRVFESTHLDQVFRIFSNHEEALARIVSKKY